MENLDNISLDGLDDLGALGGDGLDFGTDIGADSWGTTQDPQFLGGDTKTLEGYKITGIIVGKKNYLSPDYSREKAKVEWDRVYLKAVESGVTDYEEVKELPTGEVVGKDKRAELKPEFKIGALKALDYDAYRRIRQGAYKVTLSERNAEFLVLTNFERLEQLKSSPNVSPTLSVEQMQDISGGATNDDLTVNIVKLESLADLCLQTHTVKMDVVEYDHTNPAQNPVKLATAVPEASTTTNKKGEVKLKFNMVYVGTDTNEIKKIGDIPGIKKAFNRSYEGETPTDIETIENMNHVQKLFGDSIDPYSLGRLKTKADIPEGESIKKHEEIPYEQQSEAWAVLGVTPEMLAGIRQTGTSSKRITNRDMMDIFNKGLEIYMTHQNLHQA